MFDSHTNFPYSLIATAPSPASSGTSLVVTAGEGLRFPTPPFNATVCPLGAIPTLDNAEIVRVTAITTDTFTITRTQEGTSARTILVGDQIFGAITAKSFTDVETHTQAYKNVNVPDTGVTVTFAAPFTTDLDALGDYIVHARAHDASGTNVNLTIARTSVDITFIPDIDNVTIEWSTIKR